MFLAVSVQCVWPTQEVPDAQEGEATAWWPPPGSTVMRTKGSGIRKRSRLASERAPITVTRIFCCWGPEGGPMAPPGPGAPDRRGDSAEDM